MASLDSRLEIEKMRELHTSIRTSQAQLVQLQAGQQENLVKLLDREMNELSNALANVNLWAAKNQLGGKDLCAVCNRAAGRCSPAPRGAAALAPDPQGCTTNRCMLVAHWQFAGSWYAPLASARLALPATTTPSTHVYCRASDDGHPAVPAAR